MRGRGGHGIVMVMVMVMAKVWNGTGWPQWRWLPPTALTYLQLGRYPAYLLAYRVQQEQYTGALLFAVLGHAALRKPHQLVN